MLPRNSAALFAMRKEPPVSPGLFLVLVAAAAFILQIYLAAHDTRE